MALSALAQHNSYQEALDKYQKKQYVEALPLAEEALREDRTNPTYFHLYGSILAALDQYYLAEENLRKAVALAPDQPAFAYDLGALLHQERKYVEAVPVLKRAMDARSRKPHGAHDAGAIATCSAITNCRSRISKSSRSSN